MKKGGILNPAICSLLAELGHMDDYSSWMPVIPFLPMVT